MAWNDDSWRDSYDTWKLASPDYDEPEEECWHEEYEADWEGRATCDRCGHSWFLTSEQIEADRAHSEAYDRYVRRDERLEKWRRVRAWFRSMIPSRRRKHVLIDDDIPF